MLHSVFFRRHSAAARGPVLRPLVLLALLALLTVPARTGPLEQATVKETVFPNGLRLIVKEAHATDLAAVQMWVRVGGFTEDAQTAGTAHVIEHLVFKSSGGNAPGAIDAEIENLGGLLEAATEKDWTRFGCTVSGRYIAKAISVIAEALRKPQFRQADYDAEKPLILQEIEQVRGNPEAIIAALLYQLAFQEHPYRHDVRGTPELLRFLDLKTIEAYYRKHYVPANMTLVVVGAVDAAGVERVVRTAFEADKPAPKPEQALPKPERACSKAERRVLPSPFNAGYLGIAFPGPSVKDDPDVYAMDVLLTLLEDGDGGRLPRLLKNSAAVSVTFETRRQPGLLSIIAGTPPGSVEQVETLIRRELDFLVNNAIPPAEVAYAKRALRGSYLSDCETYAGQAGTLGYYDSIDSWKFASDYLANVEKVTPEQVQEVARKYLKSDESVAVILKPRAAAPAAPQAPPKTGT